MQITLFTTEGCHLCEQAYDLLRSLPDSHALQIDLQFHPVFEDWSWSTGRCTVPLLERQW